jgi:hypothetical protein
MRVMRRMKSVLLLLLPLLLLPKRVGVRMERIKKTRMMMTIVRMGTMSGRGLIQS